MDTLLFSSLCLAIATGLSYLGNLTALFDLISHFRIHYLLAALILLPFAVAHPSKVPLAVILLATIVNAIEVLPWYIKPKSEKSDAKSVSVTSINVQFNNHGVQKIIDFIMWKKSDVLFLSELNERWIKALRPLKKLYPHEFIEDPGNQFGIGIFSKYQMGNCRVVEAGDFGDPSIMADVKVKAGIVRCVNIHPVPPLDTKMLHSRNRTFAKVACMTNSSPYPVIVGGDSNSTMWSTAYKRMIRHSGLKNSRKGFGIMGTWPFEKPNHKNFRNGDKKRGTDWIPSWMIHGHPIKLPIDHILVSPEIIVKNMSAGPEVGSDHLPITAELQIPCK